MKFPTPIHEVAPPPSLKILDDTFGSQTQEAFQAAVDIAPALGQVAVCTDIVPSRFLSTENGLGDSQIVMCENIDYYKMFIDNGLASIRMQEFTSMFKGSGIELGLSEIVTYVFLHEMGHAYDIAGYIKRASGNTTEAHVRSRAVRMAEIATLPLGLISSKAIELWESNSRGYRTRLEMSGVTEEMWVKKLAENTQAYNELPCEKIADAFALSVLARVSRD